jgi:23S rRNA (adenine2503-C2)-methyltransferase
VLVEYVLLAGVNDGPDDARALCALLDQRLVKLDLIDVNGEVGGYSRSTGERRRAFLDELSRGRLPFGIRYSGGQDVSAGCGQLAARRVDEPVGACLK